MARDPKWLRQTGRVLSSLVQASDDDLEEFVRERLDGAEVEPARVADARAILLHVGEALRNPTPEQVMRLEYTRRVFEEWTPNEDGHRAPTSGVASAPVPSAVPAPSPVALPMSPPPMARPQATERHEPSPWAGKATPPSSPPKATASTDPPLPVALPSPVVPPSVPAPVTPQRGPLPDAVLPVVLPTGDIDSTAVPETSLGPVAPLPFAKGRGAAPKRVSLEPHAAMGQTAPLKNKGKKSTLPFKAFPEAAAALPSVEQYAYFCTERALWPDHQSQTCAKYGIEPADEELVHEHYRRAFENDPQLKTRFNELRAAARAQLGR